MLMTSAAATTYKWVDSTGVTHYSDRPEPGAQEVQIDQAQTYTPQPIRPVTSQANQQPVAEPYTKLDLWKPQDQEYFINEGQTIEVRLRLEPDLQAGHAIWLYLDGKRIDGLPGSGDTFTLNEVYRGTHTLAAVVTDASGKRLISSQEVTFYVQQASVNSPTRVPRPTPH
jgi:hypothetical protein